MRLLKHGQSVRTKSGSILWRPMPKPKRLQEGQIALNFALHELRLNLEKVPVYKRGRIRAKLMDAQVLEKHRNVALEEAIISWYPIVDDITIRDG